MNAVWVVVGCMVIALIIVFNMVLKLQKKYKDQVPDLKEDEHIPVIKKGESNLSIINKGNDILVSDEKGNLIPFKKALE